MARVLVALFVGVGLSTVTAGQALAAPTAVVSEAARPPIASPLPRGTSHRTWTVADYVAAWEEQHGRPMTEEEHRNLARGCIGVTVVNLERDDVVNPPLGLSFGTFEQARAVQAALNEIIAQHPTPQQYAALVRRHPLLGRMRGATNALPTWLDSGELTAAVFSKRFWTKQDPTWTDAQAKEFFRPNATTGQVDMSRYRYVARPGYVNFDYGWYDEGTRNWWHANHSEPDMEVYQSTVQYYSRPLLDFDAQVFTVAFARVS